MGSSGSQQPVTQQTTQTRDPWSVAQPFLGQAMGQAQNLYTQGIGYKAYPGDTVAPLDPVLAGGLNYQNALAQQNLGGTPGVNASRTVGTGLINNYGLSPEMQNLYNEASTTENPYLQNILNTQGRQISDRVNASMAGAGRYGSGAHTDVMTRALAESADPILAQDYTRRQQQRQSILESGLQRQGQWSQLMPTLDQAQYQPAQNMAAVGQYYQDRQQQALSDQIKRFNAEQAYPWEQLARYNAIIGGAGGLGGSTVTTTPGATQPSTLNKILGGAAAGAGIGSMFGPGIGTGIGALGGGLLGMM